MFDNVMQMSYSKNMILFDASTLILLAKIEMLDIFVTDFEKKVVISDKVWEEVLEGSSPDVPLIARLVEERGIDVLRAKDKKLVRKLIDGGLQY